MKSKLVYIIPIAIAALLLVSKQSTLISLRPMEEIELGTLFMTFPIILALTERFNEIFIVSKEESRETNIKKTTLASFSVAIVLAIAGFRILETFMELPTENFQEIIFKLIDTVLTAVVIAGGTDGWHQLVALIQDITKSKRAEVKATKNS